MNPPAHALGFFNEEVVNKNLRSSEIGRSHAELILSVGTKPPARGQPCLPIVQPFACGLCEARSQMGSQANPLVGVA